jgi:transmembrane sensor
MSFQMFRSSDMPYPKSDPNEQAAYWFAIVQNESCSTAQLKAFSHWLAASQDHQNAYDDVAAMYEQSQICEDDDEIMALRREALGLGKPKIGSIQRHAKKYLAAAAVFFVALLVIPQWHQYGQSDPLANEVITNDANDTNRLRLVTAVGEQLTRTLNEGSMIELNTDSEIKVHLTDAQRSIYLLKGQAVFSVAHDENRPFVVFAGDRRVTALGTTFEVRLGEELAQVTLLEGKVKVDELHISDKPIETSQTKASVELLPGQRYVSNSAEKIKVEAKSIESELSWRQGRHIFVDEKISTIVEELNRYTERKIIISDPQIGELRTSANFKMGSTQSLSAALGVAFGLSVTSDTSNNTITIDWE